VTKDAVTASIAIIDIKEDAMATLTIRNLEDGLKSRLRLRAAAGNRSMEEEARRILRTALQDAPAPSADLGTRIRARFAALGDVQLVTEPREPARQPPDLAQSKPVAPPAKRQR
jgi:antitoxin FitA